MDYLYENLGDDRFQELCQALLINEQGNVQCFPVGMPDGGRDAVVYTTPRYTDNAFNVYQVKYVKKPLAENTPHKWLIETMEREIPKVATLIPKGAKNYYLITNIPGTSHLGVGSIDLLNELLGKALDIPFQCWWRDDINRRMDNAYDLKWAYPEVLSGTDMLRLVVQAGSFEDKERRTSAIKAYVRAQYDRDADVRFKQVDLQHDLVKLFVDVPLGCADHADEATKSYFRGRGALGLNGERDTVSEGAIKALLDPNIQSKFPHVVVEGAPGQGKSTLAQYLCQIHRMGILQENDAFASLPEEHRTKGRRLPLKADLRDLAVWLAKKDPFDPDNEAVKPEHWDKSLEAFLAAQVRRLSGGIVFTVADLHAVFRVSSVLLVLDALDEVPSISERKEVIAEIISGVNRLRDSASSLQVLITSRPSIFSASISLPIATFPHLQLLPLSKSLIVEYADKWLKAGNLDERDASDVKRILSEKIEQPHLRDLAQNPMQLSILLSLMHTRGVSLPDKRTALYQQYIDLFLSREAEKSKIVAEHRELLINVYQYLAWVLHSEAEKGVHKGAISDSSLREKVSEYLSTENLDGTLVETLFTGVVDRIMFLVSRIKGTFEFETQPLREYFAARHLFVTTPYSPPGSEYNGSLPDRLDAIVQNPYWLNVTRFFAGCFDKGQLPCIIDRLNAYSESDFIRSTSRPKRLAAMLLGDWVFSQDQRSTRKAIEFVLNDFGNSSSMRFDSRFGDSVSGLVQPEENARRELISQCFSKLQQKPSARVVFGLTYIVVMNIRKKDHDLRQQWKEQIVKSDSQDLTYWLQCGNGMGALSWYNIDELEHLFRDKTLMPADLCLIFQGDRSDFLGLKASFCQPVIDSMLNGSLPFRRQTNSILSRFNFALNLPSLTWLLQHSGDVTVREIFGRFGFAIHEASIEKVSTDVDSHTVLNRCLEVVKVAEAEYSRVASEWLNGIEPWDKIVEALRDTWGENLVNLKLANIAASTVRRDSNFDEFSVLHDSTKSLCKRFAHSRLRRSSPSWWTQQFDQAKTTMDTVMFLTACLSSATFNTIIKCWDRIQYALDSLDPYTWKFVATVVDGRARAITLLQPLRLDHDAIPASTTPRIIVALGQRCTTKDQAVLFERHLRSYVGNDQPVLEFCIDVVKSQLAIQPSLWNNAMSFATKLRKSEIDFFLQTGDIPTQAFIRKMPLQVADQIATNYHQYPVEFISWAELRYQFEAEKRIMAVGRIAIRNKWFIHKD